MSTATDSTLRGKFDEITGKVKQTIGEAADNDHLANEGAAQQVKGHTEQAWGAVKGVAEDTTADLKARHEAEDEHKAHSIRESIVSAAEKAKQSIEESVESFRNDHKL